MSRFELFSPEGLRVDGRRWNELRQFECGLNTHAGATADGSAVVQQGATKVVCIVEGPREPDAQGRREAEQRALISVSISVAPFSTADRKKRPQRSDRRIQELSLAIQRTFDEAVMGHLHPRTEIAVRLHVLAQDGGLLAACVNATSLALMDAGVPMYDYVSACSAALYDSKDPLLDPNAAEEADLSFVTVGVIGKSDKLSLVSLENRMPLDRLEPVFAVTRNGCHALRDLMDREVRRHGTQRVSKLVA